MTKPFSYAIIDLEREGKTMKKYSWYDEDGNLEEFKISEGLAIIFLLFGILLLSFLLSA